MSQQGEPEMNHAAFSRLLLPQPNLIYPEHTKFHAKNFKTNWDTLILICYWIFCARSWITSNFSELQQIIHRLLQTDISSWIRNHSDFNRQLKTERQISLGPATAFQFWLRSLTGPLQRLRSFLFLVIVLKICWCSWNHCPVEWPSFSQALAVSCDFFLQCTWLIFQV